MTGATIGPRDMIARLVGFDTTSRLSNLPLIDFVRNYLADFSIDSTLVHSHDGAKANLYATIGPLKEDGIVLSGHTDTVPVDGQDWSSDPFTISERDDRLYGRGTCDMKGFIAIALAMVPEFAARPLTSPIHLAFSFDEEVGCLGARSLIEHMVEHLPRPKIAIIGEPTNMTVVNAHKDYQGFITDITGLEAHSSATHLGANAIMAASEYIGELTRIREEMEARGDPSGRFDPPHTTVHVGTIDGGTAVNIVPRHCGVHWECRGLPDLDREEIPSRLDAFSRTHILPKMRAVSADCRVETACTNVVPPLVPQPGCAAERLALRLARQNDTYAVSYGTEAGMFQEAGMSAVICGPGSIEQAHKPDEYLALDQITQCALFMERLVSELR